MEFKIKTSPEIRRRLTKEYFGKKRQAAEKIGAALDIVGSASAVHDDLISRHHHRQINLPIGERTAPSEMSTQVAERATMIAERRLGYMAIPMYLNAVGQIVAEAPEPALELAEAD